MDKLDDIESAQVVTDRMDEKGSAIEVNIDEL